MPRSHRDGSPLPVSLTISKAIFGRTLVGWSANASETVAEFHREQIIFVMPGGRRIRIDFRDRLKPISDIVINSDEAPYFIAIRPNAEVIGLKSFESRFVLEDNGHDTRYITLFTDENIGDVAENISALNEKYRLVMRHITSDLISCYDPFHIRVSFAHLKRKRLQPDSTPSKAAKTRSRQRIVNNDSGSSSNWSDIYPDQSRQRRKSEPFPPLSRLPNRSRRKTQSLSPVALRRPHSLFSQSNGCFEQWSSGSGSRFAGPSSPVRRLGNASLISGADLHNHHFEPVDDSHVLVDGSRPDRSRSRRRRSSKSHLQTRSGKNSGVLSETEFDKDSLRHSRKMSSPLPRRRSWLQTDRKRRSSRDILSSPDPRSSLSLDLKARGSLTRRCRQQIQSGAAQSHPLTSRQKPSEVHADDIDCMSEENVTPQRPINANLQCSPKSDTESDHSCDDYHSPSEQNDKSSKRRHSVVKSSSSESHDLQNRASNAAKTAGGDFEMVETQTKSLSDARSSRDCKSLGITHSLRSSTVPKNHAPSYSNTEGEDEEQSLSLSSKTESGPALQPESVKYNQTTSALTPSKTLLDQDVAKRKSISYAETQATLMRHPESCGSTKAQLKQDSRKSECRDISRRSKTLSQGHARKPMSSPRGHQDTSTVSSQDESESGCAKSISNLRCDEVFDIAATGKPEDVTCSPRILRAGMTVYYWAPGRILNQRKQQFGKITEVFSHKKRIKTQRCLRLDTGEKLTVNDRVKINPRSKSPMRALSEFTLVE